MSKQRSTVQANSQTVDFDALFAERRSEQAPAKTFRLFGDIHAVEQVNTPAGALRLAEMQRDLAKYAALMQGADEMTRSALDAQASAESVVDLLCVVAPSLKKHRDKLMGLTFDEINAIIDGLGIDFAAVLGTDTSDENEGGEDENDDDTVEGKSLGSIDIS